VSLFQSPMDALRISILLAILSCPLGADTPATILPSGNLEPTKSSGSAGEEVRLENGPGVTLSGILTVPSGAGPHPAVVLLSGLREGERALTEHLANAGVAVLTFDARGSGKSSGTFLSWMPDTTAVDALAWIRWLGTRPGIDPKRIGLVGHSQGGVAAGIAAGREPERIAFVVLLAAVGVPVDEWQLHQMADRGRALGLDAAVVAKCVELQHDLFRHVVGVKDNAAALKIAQETATRHLAGFTPEERQQLELNDEVIKGMIKQAGEPWFREFLAYDPRPAFRKVKCPVLALHGSSDIQVAAKENLEGIAAALKDGGNLRVKTIELPGLDHEFRTRAAGSIREPSPDQQPLAATALTAVCDWIREQTRR
jgi:uncharacterized protein